MAMERYRTIRIKLVHSVLEGKDLEQFARDLCQHIADTYNDDNSIEGLWVEPQR